MSNSDMLLQFLQQNPFWLALAAFIAFLIRYWNRVETCVRDIRDLSSEFVSNCALSTDFNPKMKNSFLLSYEIEPILRLFRGFGPPLQMRIRRKTKNVQIELPQNKALAILPSGSTEHRVTALAKHAEDNLSSVSAVNDNPKIEKALELFLVDSLVKNSYVNGSFKMAATKYINGIKTDNDIKTIYEIIHEVNSKLKQFETKLERSLLRILLIEMCRVQFDGASEPAGTCLCEFVKFLESFNSRAPGFNISPTFKCDGINVSLVPVGRHETTRSGTYGYEPYVSFIKAAAKGGIEAFYVLARGRLNCCIAEEVVWQAQHSQLLKMTDEFKEEIEYGGRSVQVLCIRLENTFAEYDPFSEYTS